MRSCLLARNIHALSTLINYKQMIFTHKQAIASLVLQCNFFAHLLFLLGLPLLTTDFPVAASGDTLFACNQIINHFLRDRRRSSSSSTWTNIDDVRLVSMRLFSAIKSILNVINYSLLSVTARPHRLFDYYSVRSFFLAPSVSCCWKFACVLANACKFRCLQATMRFENDPTELCLLPKRLRGDGVCIDINHFQHSCRTNYFCAFVRPILVGPTST